jgi:TolB-like protein/class 3 adenylate cyclase
MHESGHQLAAIMFTDIVGYTSLIGEDEKNALALLAENREIHKLLIAQYHGEQIKEMGDGTLASFSSAINAVRCAIEIQRLARKGSLANKLRIGIHLGDITRNNKDVFGEGVNIASRLQSIANPGGIFLSEDIQHLIRAHKDIEVKYLGLASLKNVAVPVKTYAIKGAGLPISKLLRAYKLPHRRESIGGLLIVFIALAIIFWKSELFTTHDVISSIAIMPFENLSVDQSEQAYFIEGMTNTLITNLSKVAALKIKFHHNPNSSIKSGKSMTEIGKNLGVDAIIRGAVLREGSMVRISAQLIDVSTEELLWTDSYDRDITSILKLHSEVAQAIVSEVKVAVTAEEVTRLRQAPEINANAYESLLKGYYHLYKLNPEHYDSAQFYFEDALSQGTVNARANSGLALLWVHKAQWGSEAPLVAAMKARKFAYKAMEQDSTLATTHLALCSIYTSFDWNWQDGIKAFKETIKLNPNMPEARLFYADLLVSLHKDQEALEQIDAALNIDPFNAFSHSLKGWVLFATRNYDEAIIALNKSLESEPMIALTHRCLWSIYHLTNNHELAIKHASLFYASQNLAETAAELESKFLELGYTQALKFAADNLAARATKQYFSSMRVARLYAFSSHKELAIHWLNKAYDEHYISFFSLNVDPHWQSLHQEPQFINLVDKMNLTIAEYKASKQQP